MKKHLKLSLAVLCFAAAATMWGCANPDEYLPETAYEVAPQTRSVMSLEEAVYQESTDSWIVPQKDPYALDNFRQAFNNVKSDSR